MRRSLLSAVLSLSILLSALVTAHAASYTFTTIDAPNAIDTEATSINTRGQIVGFYAEDTGPVAQPAHGFLYENGVFTILRVPGAFNTFALGLNDGGQIVGYYQVLDAVTGSFLYDNGLFTTVDVPGAAFTVAQGINNKGQIVGYYGGSSTTYGFLSDKGRITTIEVPGSLYRSLRHQQSWPDRGALRRSES